MAMTRVRRLLKNPCSPAYLGYLVGYCSSCQEHLVPGDHRVSNLAKFIVLFVDAYHVVVHISKAYFLMFNVTMVGTGCMLDYLDILGR